MQSYERMKKNDIYTKDGTKDYHNQMANKSKTGKWKACRYIIGSAALEKLAFYGVSTNLVNYLIDKYDMGFFSAATSVSNWMGTVYVMPLISALIADAYWGKYWTMIIFGFLNSCGMALLTMTTFVHGLTPPCEEEFSCHPTITQLKVFRIAMLIIALGAGGMKPCISSFGADQFDDADDTERANKSAYFNWLYFSVNAASLISSTVLVVIQYNSWIWGLGIPSAAMAIAFLIFASGTPFYRYQRPGGSPLTRICQVIIASLRKWRAQVPEDTSLLYETVGESIVHGSRKLEHTDGFRFLDKAAVDEDVKTLGGPWTLCTVTQVEELKSIIRLLPICATGIMFGSMHGQMSTLFIIQGDTLDGHVGTFRIPAASLQVFAIISVLIFIPLYDSYIVPLARRFTKHESGLTLLQRMGIGLIISIIAMLAASFLEFQKLQMVRRTHKYDELRSLPISIFWQIPQYFLMGCAEVFTFIGQMHFFYDQAPDAMRSMCTALSMTTIALGRYMSAIILHLIIVLTRSHRHTVWIPYRNLNRGHLDYFFLVMALLSVVNFLVFLYISKSYTYKKVTITLEMLLNDDETDS